MEHYLNALNEESLKIGFKIREGKPNYKINIGTIENLQTDETETEKVTDYKYLGQITVMENRTRQEVSISRMECFWKV